MSYHLCVKTKKNVKILDTARSANQNETNRYLFVLAVTIGRCSKLDYSLA